MLLEAEPGAGKSTLAPLWALALTPPDQAVWLIQPRILAARAVARRLADLLGSRLGDTVGYQVPFDRVLGAHTRLQVMTPGVFLQRLLSDPELSGVGAVLLDEVHERSVDMDLAWVWLQECQIIRDDLTLVLMTATPDPRLRQQVAQRLYAPGRQFPVTTQYLPPQPGEALAAHVMRALRGQDRQQTVLVFLPGWRAINDCARALSAQPDRAVYRLHSRVADTEQSAALDATSGPRIILATNLAETSLTVPDVTLVIDSGLARTPDLDTATGAVRLRTGRISRANADQRRGRAGRVQAGECLRLWADSEALPPASRPEITHTDALPLALRLAHWGTPDGELNWPDRPSGLALEAALGHLQRWEHIDDHNRITAAGRQVSALGTHPRIAALLQGCLSASHAAATLPEDILDMALALHFDLPPEAGRDWLTEAAQARRQNKQWQQQSRRWLRVLNAQPDSRPWPTDWLLGPFADRIGHRQASGRYTLSNGASILPLDPVIGEWACFPTAIATRDGHCGVAIEVDLNTSQQRALSTARRQVQQQKGKWYSVTTWVLGDCLLDTQRQPVADADVPNLLVHQIKSSGDFVRYPWPKAALELLHRARLAATHGLLLLPDLQEEALLNTLEDWLLPFLHATSALDQLPWFEGLRWYLGQDRVDQLNRLLPKTLTLVGGRTCTIDYVGDHAPKVVAKLQDFFGTEDLSIAEGRLPVTACLLSPAQRPLAVTADLVSFWQNVYPEVRKEMRGRYPKHSWPPSAH